MDGNAHPGDSHVSARASVDGDSTDQFSFRELAAQVLEEQQQKSRSESSPGAKFAESFNFEINRSVLAAAQIVGKENQVVVLSQPEESTNALAQHAQMAGRAVAGLLPTVGMAFASRFGIGKLLGHETASAEHVLLKRSALGLSAVESSATGFLVGSVLTPSEVSARENLTSFVGDRIRSGVTSGAAFGVLSASSHGWNKLASTELATSLKIGGTMKSSIVSGLVSGIPGGIANVEFDSLARTGSINSDREQLGKSVYEMSLFGGSFGLASRVLQKPIVAKPEEIQTPIEHGPAAFYLKNQMNYSERIDHLSQVFGADSHTTARLIQIEEKSSAFSPVTELTYFLDAHPDTKALVEAEIGKVGSDYFKLSAQRLEGLKMLHAQLGEESPTLTKMLALEDGAYVQLNGFAKFIEADPARRVPLVERFVANGVRSKEISLERLQSIEPLERLFGANSKAAAGLLQLESETELISLPRLIQFINKDPEPRKVLINDIVERHAPAAELYEPRLEALLSLQDKFGADSAAMQRIRLVEEETKNPLSVMTDLDHFIRTNPERGPALILDELNNGADASDLSFNSLNIRNVILQALNDDHSLERVLQHNHGDQRRLGGIARFIQEDPTRNSQLLRETLEGSQPDAPPLTTDVLRVTAQLRDSFGKDSPTISHLQSSGANLDEVVRFIKHNQDEHAPVVQSLAKLGGHGDKFTDRGLHSFQELSLRAEPYSEFMRVMEPLLARPGQHVEEIANYLNLTQSEKILEHRVNIVMDAINGGAAPEQLNFQNLNAIDKLISHAAPSDLPALLAMNQDGLGLHDLATHVETYPPTFAPLLQELLGNGGRDSSIAETNPYVAITRLFSELGQEPDLTYRLLTKVLGSLDEVVDAKLVDYLRTNPEARLPLLEDSLNRHQSIDSERLQGIETLNSMFGANSGVMYHLWSLDGAEMSVAELAKFVQDDPVRNKALVESVVRENGSESALKVPRLRGLQQLQDSFGTDSELTIHFLALEENRYPIADLGQLLHQHPEHVELIKGMVANGADAAELHPERLSGLTRLQKMFGDDAPRLEKILNNEPHVALFALANFVDGVHSPTTTPADVAVRKRILEREIDAGRTGFALDGDRLEALFQLESKLGENSPGMKKFLQGEKNGNISLSDLGEFLMQDPQHGPFLAKLAEALTSGEQSVQTELGLSKISRLCQLDRIVGMDLAMLRNAIAFEDQGIYLGDVSTFALKNPEINVRLIRQALESGVGKDMDIGRLSGIAALEERFGVDSAVVIVIRKHEQNIDIAALGKLLQKEPEKYEPLIMAAAADGGNSMLLDPNRLAAVANLQKAFQHNPSLIAKLAQIEADAVKQEQSGISTGFKMSNLTQYSGDAYGRPSLVERLLEENAPLTSFRLGDLRLRQWLEVQSDMAPTSAKRLLDLAATTGCGSSIREFLACNYDSMNLSQKIATLDRLVEMKAPPNLFESSNLINFISLEKQLSRLDQQLPLQIVDLVRDGLNLPEAASFITNGPECEQLFVSLLKKKAPVKDFSLSSLNAKVELAKLRPSFDQSEMVALEALHDRGLSSSRLANFVAESAATRVPLVKQLIEEKSDVSRFNKIMSLSVLPENVALRLVDAADNGGMPVASVLANLKDWRGGPIFRKLIIDQVESGRSLALQDSEALAAESKYHWNYDDGTSDLKPGLYPANSMPEILQASVQSILAKVPRDKNIVLLGRDMWAVLPALRAAKRDVQYFLWSSIQNDANTPRQWLKEVPPNSAVIDSGYSGSIINKIRKSDPSASGFLLSTDGSRYPRLLDDPEHNQKVDRIENMPKLIGRTTGYTERGGAISHSTDRESNDVQQRRQWNTQQDRWTYERNAREMFRAMGLPEWDTWRYSNFTGLTPRERLGLSSNDELQAHYRRVEHARGLMNGAP